MLPASYATPAAAILAAGGLLACFFGYRLFRFVLGLYGFILGALVTTSMMAPANTWTLVMAAIVGGLIGGLLMVVAYFIGVGLIGAGLAALAINLVWRLVGGPVPTVVLVIACVLGALGALSVVRYVVIFGTALAGSWTMIIGGWALLGNPTALRAASAIDIWVLYPFDLVPNHWWVVPVWLVVALVGIVVQMATSNTVGKSRKRKT
jgi:hypothetical protein